MNGFFRLSIGGGRVVLWVGSRLCLSTNYDSEFRFSFDRCYPRYLRIQIFRFAVSYWID